MKKLLLALLLLCAPLQATTFYVAKAGSGGSDANSCATAQTHTTGKLTIAAGIACMSSGDTLQIKAGTYLERITNSQVPTGGGSWATATTIKHYSTDVVVLQPSSSGHVIHVGDNRSYIIFDGLTLDGVNAGGTPNIKGGYEGLAVRYSDRVYAANYIRFTNGEIKNTSSLGVSIDQNSHHCEVLNSLIHDNGDVAQFEHGFYWKGAYGLIEGNTIYNNAAYGITMYNGDAGYPPNYITVRNNKVYNNCRLGPNTDSGPGIGFASGSYQTAYNNIIYGNKGGIEVLSGSNYSIYNNTIYANNVGTSPRVGISIQAGTTITVRNNIIYGNTAGTISGTPTVASNNLTTNPDFTNAGAADFTIKASSQAIGNGWDLSAVFTTDYAGTSRTVPFDIGAYKYASATPSITVVTPNGGETWEIGTTQSITWTSAGLGAHEVKITADLDGNGSYETTIDASDPNDGTFDWTVSGSANASCKVKVEDQTDAAVYDVSNAVFATTAAPVTGTITLTSPTVGYVYAKGSNVVVTWSSTDVSGNVTIELSRNNGNTWATIATVAYNSPDYVYVATTPSSSTCKIRVTSVNQAAATATSAAFRLGGRIM